MAGERYLFPDRREERSPLMDAQRVASTWYASLDVVLERLRRIDWAYPALFIYREEGEDRWSQVMLGLSLRPELGED